MKGCKLFEAQGYMHMFSQQNSLQLIARAVFFRKIQNLTSEPYHRQNQNRLKGYFFYLEINCQNSSVLGVEGLHDQFMALTSTFL